jgi:hypothetical protein
VLAGFHGLAHPFGPAAGGLGVEVNDVVRVFEGFFEAGGHPGHAREFAER